MSDTRGYDDQDQSETFDEDMTDDVDAGPRQHEMKTFEELPDLVDVTTAAGDGLLDDVELDAADFEEGVLDDEDLEEDLYEDAAAETDGDEPGSSDGGDLDDTDGVAGIAAGEVELIYAGDLHDAAGAGGSAARFESRGELDQDDVDDLGYGDDADAEEEEEEEEEADGTAGASSDGDESETLRDDGAATATRPHQEDASPHAPHARPAGDGDDHDHLAPKLAGAEDRQEALVDEAVEETFPASDPISPKHIT